MEGKEELLKLAHKQLDQAAKLLKAAGEELLAEEAEALAVRGSISPKRPFTLSCPSRRTRRTSSAGRT
jgi:hypothetical protein